MRMTRALLWGVVMCVLSMGPQALAAKDAEIKLDYYKGSANNNSSLFRDNFTVSVSVGLIWATFQSKQQVKE